MASGELRGECRVRSPRSALRGTEASFARVEAFPRLVTVAREFASGGARIAGLVAPSSACSCVITS